MDMARSALSLVIRKNGAVSDSDIDYVISFYREKKGITLDQSKYRQAVQVASDKYERLAKGLFVCTDKPCLRKSFVNPSDESIELLSKDIECPIEITGCHWQCEQAPVVTLKVGTASQSLVRCTSDSWESIRRLIAELSSKAEEVQTQSV
jgi:hypothetical protein